MPNSTEYLLPVVSEGLNDATIENASDVGYPKFLENGLARIKKENPLLYAAVFELVDTPPRKPQAVIEEMLSAAVLTHELLQRQKEAEKLNKKFEM